MLSPCYVGSRKSPELIDDLLTEAETGKSSISMHIINLGEVFCRLCRVSGTKRGEEILDKIRMLPIQILSISDEEVMEADKIKAKCPISYADAFAVAKALQSGATVVTGDPEYKKVSKIVGIL